ncbi:MAG TPA: DUF998 domain-containing protein [Acidimicrobiales bacterium]|nr:DUF998 domain-containing protein [Acidimicrobiales bacterium]
MAVGGVIGPIAFVLAWAVLGEVTDGFSHRHDAISDLAADGASTQPAMTAALLVLGVGMVLFGNALRTALRPLAGTAAVVAGIADIGVAAFPVGAGVDRIHGDVATVAYIATVATPLLAVRPYAARGRRAQAGFAAVAALVTLACVIGMRYGSDFGLWQRVGLTASHLWIAVTALTIAVNKARAVPGSGENRGPCGGVL